MNCNPSRATRLLSFFAVFFLALLSLQAQPNTDAQGDVGIGTRTPHASAILDLTSTSKGFLLPRMTTAQRNGIGSPANGLMIYNTDEGTFQLFSNASGTPKWDTVLSTGSKAGWLTKGNTGLVDGTDNFFGTKDNVNVRFITNNTERMRLTGGGNLNITAPTAITGTLSATGATTLSSTLGVTGATTLSSTLGVAGSATVGGAMSVAGATALNSTLSVAGASTLNGTLTGNAAANALGAGTAAQQLTVRGVANAAVGNTLAANPTVWDLVVTGDQVTTGIAKFGGSLWLDGLSATHTINASAPLQITTTGAGNNITINSSGGTTTVNDNLTVTGATSLNGTLGVTGATTLSSTLGVTGNTTVGGTLGVTGATTLSGATTVNNTLGVTGATTLGSTLGVAGNTTIGGTLGVTGATTLNGATTVNNTFGATGATTLGNTLNVAGATTLNSTLGVAGNTTVGGTLGVTGAATFNSTITQTGTGQVTFGGNVDANNGLDVAGANLNVNSAVDIIAPGFGHSFGTLGTDATAVTINGLANTVGSYELVVNGDAQINGTLNFAGFTPGSVIFAGTGGALAQDNGNFFWDDVNNRLGLGTTSTSARLDVVESGAVPAIEATNSGTSNAGSFAIINAGSVANAVSVIGNHIGNGISVALSNPSNGGRGIDVAQSGVGPGVFATSAGGNAVWGITSSISAAGVIGDNTFGEAVVGRNRGGNGVGAVVGRNDSSGYGVRGFNTKNGIGVLGQAGISGGTGIGGRFENVNAANTSPALVASTNGSGPAILTSGRVDVNNGNVSLLNSSGTAGELRLYEPSGSGANFTAFRAQAQAGDVTYTLPAADGSTGQMLTTDGTGGLAWATPSTGLTLPYSASASTASPLISLTQTGASNVGSFVISNPGSVATVLNLNHNGIGNGLAIQLSNASNGGRGVDITQSGVGPGLFATSAGGNAVWGITSSISAAGVIGDNTFGEAVVGRNRGGNGVGAVVGRNDSSGYGVRGFNTKNGYGVLGQAGISGGTGTAGRFENVNAANTSDALQVVTNSAGNAARFTGNVVINGNLTVSGTVAKGGGTFMIDHPLDPENKILYHSFVESPDMKNINDGVAILDAKGEAWVELPNWFMALNGNFRYQLTAVGAPGPGLYIAEKIKENRFKIAGGTPGMEVSWQVTGIRQDAYAQKHRVQVEVDKVGEMRGQYLHPEAFDLPAAKTQVLFNNTPQLAKMPHENLLSGSPLSQALQISASPELTPSMTVPTAPAPAIESLESSEEASEETPAFYPEIRH